MFNQKYLGEKVKALRIAAQVTQQQLGDAVGLAKAAVSMVESGKRAVSINVLCAIADFFGVTTDYLCGRDSGEPERKPGSESES
jgi:transcriptional regulator with XRE-family HTH domain